MPVPDPSHSLLPDPSAIKPAAGSATPVGNVQAPVASPHQDPSLSLLRELAKPEILNTLTQLQGRVPPSLEQPLQQLLQILTQNLTQRLAPGSGITQITTMEPAPLLQTAASSQLAAIYSRLSGTAIPAATTQTTAVQHVLQQWQLQVQLQSDPGRWNALSSQEQRWLQQQGISQPAPDMVLPPALQQKLAQLGSLLFAAQVSSAIPPARASSDTPPQTSLLTIESSTPAAITLLSPRQQLWQQFGQTLQTIQLQIQQLGTDPVRQQPAQALLRQIDELAPQLQPQSTIKPETATLLDILQSRIGPVFLARITPTANLNTGMLAGHPTPATPTGQEVSWHDWLSLIASQTSSVITAAQPEQTLLQMHTDTLDTFFRLLNQLWQPAPATHTQPAFSSQHPLGQLLNQLLGESVPVNGTETTGKNLLEQLTRPLQQSEDVRQWLQFLTQPISGSSAYTTAVQHWLWQRLQIRAKASSDGNLAELAQSPVTTTAADDSISALLHFLQPDKPVETGSQQPQLVIPLPLTRTEDETQWADIQRGPRRDDGQSGWHMTLDLPLGPLGLIRCQAYLDLPQISLRFQAERTQAVDRLQETLPEFQQRLQALGLTMTQCQIRQGKISRRSTSSRQKTSGISIRI